MNCGCAGIGTAGAGEPAQALLPLNGVLSPLLRGAIASAPVAGSIQVSAPSLAATPEAQQAAQAQVFAGQTATRNTPPAKKSSTTQWVLIAGAIGAALFAVF